MLDTGEKQNGSWWIKKGWKLFTLFFIFKSIIYISLQSFAALRQAAAHSLQCSIVNFSHSVAHLSHILAHSKHISLAYSLFKVISRLAAVQAATLSLQSWIHLSILGSFSFAQAFSHFLQATTQASQASMQALCFSFLNSMFLLRSTLLLV